MKAVIEIPKDSLYKYELDKESGKLKVDRVLPIPVPYNYGYIPGTMSGDGDPLDVFVISVQPINPLTEVEIVPFGIIRGEDAGLEDDKVLAYIKGDKSTDSSALDNIKYYLRTYKEGFVILKYDEVKDGKI